MLFVVGLTVGVAIEALSALSMTLGGHPKPAIDRQLNTGHFR